MSRRTIEVNFYEFTPRNARSASVRVLCLCEECRMHLDGRVDVREFGAEMSVPSLTCVQCGYTMQNRTETRFPASDTLQPERDRFAETFRELRTRQRQRIRDRNKQSDRSQARATRSRRVRDGTFHPSSNENDAAKVSLSAIADEARSASVCRYPRQSVADGEKDPGGLR